ncbi:MAG: Carboxyvinyl-carboxyphosphonate phosphorylmutase [Firmicutes bacterium]|nr:Carboxyvinyl-carboxyphosphonate phosphorylmutase [Bacillota bacterium]
MRKTERLKALIRDKELLIMPRVHDALSAMMAERAGAKAVQVSGFGVAATLLGMPDVGLLTLTEMALVTRHLCAAVSIPVMADGDTGFGNAINVYRTVQEMEHAGAAGINLEDQVFPKKCGHMEGKAVVSKEEMTGKIRAAVDARRDPDFIINARTDAIAVYGIDEAIRRGNAYAEAGADLIFVEAPENAEQIRRICREVKAPVSINFAEGGKTPLLTLEELRSLGVARLSCGASQSVAAKALLESFQVLLSEGSFRNHPEFRMDRKLMYEVVGLPRIREMEERYLPVDQFAARYGSLRLGEAGVVPDEEE